MSLRRRIDELRLGMMMLTRLPMGRLDDPAPTLAQARWSFPLAGLPLGLGAWAILAGLQALSLPPLATGFAVLAVLAALTGGLHHDGFADFADGMGGRDRAHRLEVMRDSRVGSYGVIAMILATGLGASALSALPAAAWAGLLLVSTASRLAMLVLLDLMPPARHDGLGQMAATDRIAAPWRVWLPGGLLTLCAALATGMAALPVLIAMMLAAAWVAWRARKLLGGQTGDVLGAAQLSSETAGWLVLAVVL
ncbi:MULTISPECIES: adenosylcobinamide-GDP ribazoletransferase [Mameliella]|uniref:adenosylcobinamide-GDP ribazoletransferase n=1 Tax=Mameliella TaxID=1434019 RepID=UPI000B536673|nr:MULTISPECIES: adenosylcobinamide-GDP ribazoletransferase [Mameliella]MCR9275094.1 adenosylcobinamide-GDP ribazoletransferase [Paracoccaceae bacterium]OWV52704.1 adenosylcobinamide-GDP ribazoletransferase [Mameliella alba]